MQSWNLLSNFFTTMESMTTWFCFFFSIHRTVFRQCTKMFKIICHNLSWCCTTLYALVSTQMGLIAHWCLVTTEWQLCTGWRALQAVPSCVCPVSHRLEMAAVVKLLTLHSVWVPVFSRLAIFQATSLSQAVAHFFAPKYAQVCSLLNWPVIILLSMTALPSVTLLTFVYMQIFSRTIFFTPRWEGWCLSIKLLSSSLGTISLKDNYPETTFLQHRPVSNYFSIAWSINIFKNCSLNFPFVPWSSFSSMMTSKIYCISTVTF